MNRVDVDIAIIMRGGKVLVCQRSEQTTFPGCWEFPGGKRERGETSEQCLLREVREEVALDVRPLAALEVIEHDYAHSQVRLHPHICQHLAGEVQLLACQAARWIDPPALRAYQFPPANERLIDEAIEWMATRGAD